MASRWFPRGPVQARHRSGWVFVVLVLVVAVPTVIGAFMPVTRLTAAVVATALVAVAIAYVYFVAPRITIDEEAITVDNPWRRHVVPWGALVDVSTRFHLTLVTADGPVHALAAPSPGGFSAMRAKPDQDSRTARVHRQGAGGVRPGDLPNHSSGQLATVVRGHWQDRVEAGNLDPSEVATTTPRVGNLVLTLGGLALVVALWLLA